MATRGWENATLNDVRDRRTPKKPAKYRNVKTVIGDQVFDSKREAAYWQGLKARAANGEISELRRQVVFPLMCPTVDRKVFVFVSSYVADFTYQEQGALVVVDAKGKRTTLYALKKKWLELQDGIQIQEV